MKILIPQAPKRALNILNENGYESYVVGGCVRDSLLGDSPKDWDITTNALPEETEKCFIGYKIIETGLKHGTITVMIDKEPLEITTYRIDGEYLDNRRPESVEFTSDIKEDLSRRDFTVNAMAYGLNDNFIDYFQGQEDLNRKIIRCVGDADKRFNEDALRILRALRFASVLDFTIDEETSKSIFRNKMLLKNIASERIIVEFNKLLCGKNAEFILNKYRDVIAVFIPEIKPMFDFDQKNPHHIYDVWKHTVKSVVSVPPNAVQRLAMLFHDIAKPACYHVDDNGVGHFYGHPIKSSQMTKDILKRLKYDNQTINTVKELVFFHDYRAVATNKSVKKLLNKSGEYIFSLLSDIQRADALAQNPIELQEKLNRIDAFEVTAKKIISSGLCFQIKDLALNGKDLINLGVPQGKRVGEVLEMLLEKVIEEKCENTKEDLTKQVKNLLK